MDTVYAGRELHTEPHTLSYRFAVLHLKVKLVDDDRRLLDKRSYAKLRKLALMLQCALNSSTKI